MVSVEHVCTFSSGPCVHFPHSLQILEILPGMFLFDGFPSLMCLMVFINFHWCVWCFSSKIKATNKPPLVTSDSVIWHFPVAIFFWYFVLVVWSFSAKTLLSSKYRFLKMLFGDLEVSTVEFVKAENWILKILLAIWTMCRVCRPCTMNFKHSFWRSGSGVEFVETVNRISKFEIAIKWSAAPKFQNAFKLEIWEHLVNRTVCSPYKLNFKLWNCFIYIYIYIHGDLGV